MILVERTPGRERGDAQSSSHLNRSLQLDLLARSPSGEDTQERAKRRASISLELKNTPKGRLVYDREWSGEKAVNTWQSVLEEVSEELHKMKVENVFESAQQFNENRFVDRYFYLHEYKLPGQSPVKAMLHGLHFFWQIEGAAHDKEGQDYR